MKIFMNRSLTAVVFIYFIQGRHALNENISMLATFERNVVETATVSNDHILYRISQDPQGSPRRGTMRNLQKIPLTDLSAVGSECSEGEFDFRMTIRTDFYAEENTWELLNEIGEVVAKSGPWGSLWPSSVYNIQQCLPNGCYNFKMYDSHGDGMSTSINNGSYRGFADGQEVFFGGAFQDIATEYFCTTPVFFSGPNNGCSLPSSEDVKFDLEVNLTTDNFGNETTWDLTNYMGDVILGEQGPLSDNSKYHYKETVGGGCYTVTFNDKYGDGFCCSLGRGGAIGSIDGENAFSIKKFGRSMQSSFCVCAKKPTEAPSLLPTQLPTLHHTSSPTSSPTKYITSPPTELTCEEHEVMFALDLTIDMIQNGHKITWDLKDTKSENIIESGRHMFHHNQPTHIFNRCIRRGCYSLTIYDSAGQVLRDLGVGSYQATTDGVPVLSSVNDLGDDNSKTNIFCTTDCPEEHFRFELDLTTDNWGNETYWELLSSSLDVVDSVQARTYHKPNTRYIESNCYPKDCYTFYLFDTWGDGICCQYGEGNISGYADGSLVFQGGVFGKVHAWFFCMN